jgi:hypothetical protein
VLDGAAQHGLSRFGRIKGGVALNTTSVFIGATIRVGSLQNASVLVLRQPLPN